MSRAGFTSSHLNSKRTTNHQVRHSVRASGRGCDSALEVAFLASGIPDRSCRITVGNSPYHKESGLRLNHVCESARSTWTYYGLPVEVPYARAGLQRRIGHRLPAINAAVFTEMTNSQVDDSETIEPADVKCWPAGQQQVDGPLEHPYTCSLASDTTFREVGVDNGPASFGRVKSEPNCRSAPGPRRDWRRSRSPNLLRDPTGLPPAAPFSPSPTRTDFILYATLNPKGFTAMHDPYEVLWGNAPGPGPARRDEIVQATEGANRAIPGLFSFFKLLLLAFVILYPLFVVWYFVSPRTFDAFMRGQPAVSKPLNRHRQTPSRQGDHSPKARGPANRPTTFSPSK